MKQFTFCLFLLFSMLARGQSGWTNINPARSFIRFSIPASGLFVIDTMDLKSYLYKTTDSIMLSCSIQFSDSSFLYYLNSTDLEDSVTYDANDTMVNPIIAYGVFIQNAFDTIYDFHYTDLSISQTGITGREYSYMLNDENQTVVRTKITIRFYYNGHDLISLFVKAPENKASQFNDFKNQFFNSIVFNE